MVPFLLLCVFSAAAESDGPRVVDIGLVAPDVLQLTIETGRVERARQEPYRPEPGDVVEQVAVGARWIRRGGLPIAAVVGDGKTMCGFDRLHGGDLDTARCDRVDTWRIDAGSGPQAPRAVRRKSKPIGFARVGPWEFRAAMRHVVFLDLPGPAQVGRDYRLTSGDLGLPAQTWRCDPATQRSGLVHASQIGFRPDDPVKVAFASCWQGAPSAWRPTSFQVVDAAGTVVHRGTATLAVAAGAQEDAYPRNHNGSDVCELDWSAVRAPGSYRIVIDGVGGSWPVTVADDVWGRAFRSAARGVYHQRSGLALGPPHTTYVRPRGFHPDDGMVVRASRTSLLDSGNGLRAGSDNFSHLVAGATDEPVADAWGGYMDAGDWDRRIQHLEVTRLLIELIELCPDLARVDLGIPESGGDLPDAIDEALWGLEVYRRMQAADGAVRGGIESAEHPRFGEASWQESLAVYAYAPDPWSSWLYAAAAARTGGWLGKRPAATEWLTSARRAFAWAEAQALPADAPHAVRDARNLAAAELYRATGEAAFHAIFRATTGLDRDEAETYIWKEHEQRDAAWALLTTRHPVDDTLRGRVRAAVLREAGAREAQIARAGFRWTKNPWAPSAWGALTVPDAIPLVRAHALTGDARWLRAIILACQFSAGANPDDLCYVTGVGRAWPQQPLHIDSMVSGQAAPEGLALFGPLDTERSPDDWQVRLLTPFCHPPLRQWPIAEGYCDVAWAPAMCEYVVNTCGRVAYVWGYLAGRPITSPAGP